MPAEAWLPAIGPNNIYHRTMSHSRKTSRSRRVLAASRCWSPLCWLPRSRSSSRRCRCWSARPSTPSSPASSPHACWPTISPRCAATGRATAPASPTATAVQAVARSQEHIAFAEQMGSRIRHKDAQLETLRDSLVTAEIDLAKTRERMSAERARSRGARPPTSRRRSPTSSRLAATCARPPTHLPRAKRRDPGTRRSRGVGAVGDRGSSAASTSARPDP